MSNCISLIDLKIHEVNNLLIKTHDYVKWQAPLEIEYMTQDDAFKVSREAMRITIRLTQVMGWLMLRKAILSGELSQEDMTADQSPILQGKTCLDHSAETDLFLPARLRKLLQISRTLYLQIMKLEEHSLKKHPSARTIKKLKGKGCPCAPVASVAKG